MKAEALTDVIFRLPNARIVIELPTGDKVLATGFVVRDDDRGDPAIILKVGRKLVKTRKADNE